MPTKREREYYRMGFRDGKDFGTMPQQPVSGLAGTVWTAPEDRPLWKGVPETPYRKPKRKLSAWNKFVKANAKKPRFRYRNGKLNLKKMAVAFRKTPAGKKKR